MARKYDVTDIDGVSYELHGVKADDKKIGFVPVRIFGADDSFEDFVANAQASELKLIIADWKYGCGVRLQGMARKSVSGGGYTDADHNKIFNELSLANPKWLPKFAGNSGALDKACKDEWERRKAENPIESNEKRIWAEFASTVSAEVEIN